MKYGSLFIVDLRYTHTEKETISVDSKVNLY